MYSKRILSILKMASILSIPLSLIPSCGVQVVNQKQFVNQKLIFLWMSPHPLLHCQIGQQRQTKLLIQNIDQSGNGGEGVETFREKSVFGLWKPFANNWTILMCELKRLESYLTKWFASFWCSCGPNFAYGSIKTMTIGKTHPTLEVINGNQTYPTHSNI